MARKTSFPARVVCSTVDNDILSTRSVKGRLREFRRDFTEACARIGITPETAGAAGVKVRITIEKMED